uniref:AsmA family protein n=1 Tax=candidate division WOR-3 bacterium TaxID=2052148 RepID=A0A7C4XDP2_UNCW3
MIFREVIMPGHRKLLKILLVVLGILIVLAIVGYIAISSFLSPAYLRNLVSKIATESLHHPVEIGNVSLKLGFKIGVGIDKINIPNLPGFSAEPMVQIEKTALNFKLFPLLRRQIVISSIDITDFSFNIEKNKENQINFVAIIPGESKGASWQLSLAKIALSKGRIRYFDAQTKSEIRITEINQHINFERNFIKVAGSQSVYLLKSRQFPDVILKVSNNIVYDTLAKNIEIKKVVVSYEPVDLNISGTIERMEMLNINLDLKIGDLSKIVSLIPQEFRPQKLSGSLGTNLLVSGSLKEPNFTGKCEIKNIAIRPKEINRDVEKINGSFSFAQNSVKNIVISGLIGNTKFEISGAVDNFKNPVLDIIINLSGNLKDFESLTNDLKGTKLSGLVSFNTTVRGALNRPSYFGDYSVTDATIDGVGLEKPITNFIIKGMIQNDAVKISECRGNIGKSDFQFSGTITNFKSPIIQINNVSNLIDLDELLPKAKKTGGEKRGGIPLTIRGSVKINKLTGMNMEFKNINTGFAYEKGIIDLKNCSAEGFDGKVWFDLYYDSKSPEPYRINTRMDKISAKKVLSRFLKFENLEANLSGVSNFLGRGLDEKAVLQNLTASGNLKLTNGEFKNFAFFNELFNWLGIKGYQAFTFNDFYCSYKIENGKTKVEDWSFVSSIGNFLTQGTIGLDGKINLNITLTLNKKESDALKTYHGDWLLPYDKNGRATVDIIATGKILSPQFKLDTARIKDRLKGVIKDEFDKKKKELEKKLKDLLKW